MKIRTLRNRQDLKGIRLDSVVNVAVVTHIDIIGKVTGSTLGFLYERTKDGFTTIQQIFGDRHRNLGRVTYSFSNDGSQISEDPTKEDYPLQPETPEYKRYEDKIARLESQLARETRSP